MLVIPSGSRRRINSRTCGIVPFKLNLDPTPPAPISSPNIAAMSITFEHDKGTELPTTHYPPASAGSDGIGYAPKKPLKIASPNPLYDCLFIDGTHLNNVLISGLFAFGSTALLLSLYNVGLMGVSVPNVVVGMALFSGGLAQFISGMWEFPRGNMFGATGKGSIRIFYSALARQLSRRGYSPQSVAHYPFVYHPLLLYIRTTQFMGYFKNIFSSKS